MRKTPLKTRKPMRRVSRKRSSESKAYKEWQLAVINRDNGICAFCGCDASECPPHHIKPKGKYPELKLDVKNGLCFCQSCHASAHRLPCFFKSWLADMRPEQYKYLYEVENE